MAKKAAKKVIGRKAMKKTKGGHYNCSDTSRQPKPSDVGVKVAVVDTGSGPGIRSNRKC